MRHGNIVEDAPQGASAQQPRVAELGARGIGLVELAESHAEQHPGRLRELDLPVIDDLDEVACGIAEVQPTAGRNLDACGLERRPRGGLVVDDETEMTRIVGRLGATFGERQELISHPQERHPGLTRAHLEPEDRRVEADCFLEVGQLERDVIDDNRPRLPVHRHSAQGCSGSESDCEQAAPLTSECWSAAAAKIRLLQARSSASRAIAELSSLARYRWRIIATWSSRVLDT
jgi:hypothetical protein